MVWLLAFVFVAGAVAQAQWEMESSGTTADLRGIDNVGGGVAWASGTNGTVLRTEDGGYCGWLTSRKREQRLERSQEPTAVNSAESAFGKGDFAATDSVQNRCRG
jgi:hypothetical protein